MLYTAISKSFKIFDDEYFRDSHERYSTRQRIQVHYVDTLREAFGLRAPEKYKIERLMADEHQLVAMSRSSEAPDSRQWFMSVFDSANCDQIDYECNKSAQRFEISRRFALPERHVEIDIQASPWLSQVFLVAGWLAVPGDRHILWFDKDGHRSETSTEWDTAQLRKTFASRSILVFAFHDRKLLMKRLGHDGLAI